MINKLAYCLKRKVINIYKTRQTLIFAFSDGSLYGFWHDQDCCETVVIEDVTGDLNDLVGETIMMAEETSQIEEPPLYESGTWTFYKFATSRGYVTVRWIGRSNGYYSEAVSHGRLRQGDYEWGDILSEFYEPVPLRCDVPATLSLLRDAAYNEYAEMAEILAKGVDDPVIKQYYEDNFG